MLWAGEIWISEHALSCLADENDFVFCVLHLLYCTALSCYVLSCIIMSCPICYSVVLGLLCCHCWQQHALQTASQMCYQLRTYNLMSVCLYECLCVCLGLHTCDTVSHVVTKQ